MTDAELSFRSQEDYISKYRRVLEYFDAVKIGLTATPALHTTDIFGEPIFKYSYREAVIDGFLIDHEPPVRIETVLSRSGIREQFVVKLRRRLKKLPKEAREQFEAAAGETPEATLQRLLASSPDEIGSWFAARAAVGPILDWQADGGTPRLMPISHHGDEIVSVTRGYGEAQRPQDFLDSFSAFVRDNVNTVAALKLVVQRPRDLTRADLRELRLALDRQGYSEANLNRAWAETKNEEIAASIIGFVRQAALGDLQGRPGPRHLHRCPDAAAQAHEPEGFDQQHRQARLVLGPRGGLGQSL